MQTSGLIVRSAALLPTRKFETTRAVYSYAELGSRGGTVDELVAENITYTFSYYARLARLHRRSYRRRLYAEMQCVGTEALATAARERRGVVLASVHLGDFDAAGAWLAEVAGLVPVVPAAAVPSRARQRLFNHARRSCGVVLRRQTATRLGDLMLELDRGRLVLVMLDRRTTGRSLHVRLLGRDALAPTTPWDLACKTGALLLPGATWRTRDGMSILWCGRPIPGSDVHRRRDVCIQALADELTWAVRQAPHQWHVPANVSETPWCAAAQQSWQQRDALPLHLGRFDGGPSP